MLPTKQIYSGYENYVEFCNYAHIKELDRDGKSILVEYDNIVVKGKVRWSWSVYGYIAGTYNVGADDLHYKIHHDKLELPKSYYSQYSTDGFVLTKMGFESWVNDELLLRHPKHQAFRRVEPDPFEEKWTELERKELLYYDGPVIRSFEWQDKKYIEILADMSTDKDDFLVFEIDSEYDTEKLNRSGSALAKASIAYLVSVEYTNDGFYYLVYSCDPKNVPTDIRPEDFDE